MAAMRTRLRKRRFAAELRVSGGIYSRKGKNQRRMDAIRIQAMQKCKIQTENRLT
jgi:hypothetical protein